MESPLNENRREFYISLGVCTETMTSVRTDGYIKHTEKEQKGAVKGKRFQPVSLFHPHY